MHGLCTPRNAQLSFWPGQFWPLKLGSQLLLALRWDRPLCSAGPGAVGLVSSGQPPCLPGQTRSLSLTHPKDMVCFLPWRGREQGCMALACGVPSAGPLAWLPA